MSKLIWINEEGLNKENQIVEKLKPEIDPCLIWCLGDLNKRPISYKNNEIIVNWSFEENKAEFFITKDYVNWFCQYYFYLIYYGEWADLEEKHIIFMQLESEKLTIKSKKPFKVKELYSFIKKNKRVKIDIYFEITIKGDPEEKSYLEGNNLWISYLGGLYDVVDPCWDEWELCKLLNWKFKKKKIKINRYSNELKELSNESALTAKEMKINNKKWENFKT